MLIASPFAPPAHADEPRITPPASSASRPLLTVNPADDDATREVPGQRLYCTALIHFLSGFSPAEKPAATARS